MAKAYSYRLQVQPHTYDSTGLFKSVNKMMKIVNTSQVYLE